MPIAVRVEPEEVQADPGATAAITVHVVNVSGIVDRVNLSVLGEAAGWCRVEPTDVGLFPGQDGIATILITPPRGARLGRVPMGIKGIAESSGDVEVGEAAINVGAAVGVQAELRPRTASGRRRATSVVVLTNVGNAPVTIQAVPFDQDEAIVFERPGPADIAVGQTVELPIRMKLPPRDVGGAHLQYQVLIEGAGELQRPLDGAVRQPRKKRWPLLVAVAAIALVVLALTQLKREDAKAITAGDPDTAPTTVAAVAATTVPGAATTAAPGAATTKPNTGPAATTKATTAPTVKATTTIQAPIGAVIPTTVKECPAAASGNAQTIAQRVLCAFEGGSSKLDAEKAFITDAVRLGLETNAKAVPGEYTNVRGTAPSSSTQSTVTFACPVDPTTKQTITKAVQSFNVDTSINKVVAATLCDGTTRFA